jgi:hypothetical protein
MASREGTGQMNRGRAGSGIRGEAQAERKMPELLGLARGCHLTILAVQMHQSERQVLVVATIMAVAQDSATARYHQLGTFSAAHWVRWSTRYTILGCEPCGCQKATSGRPAAKVDIGFKPVGQVQYVVATTHQPHPVLPR